MNKNLIIPSICFFFTSMLSAQAPTIQWQKALGGTEYDSASAVQQTSDGGYIVAGFSSSNDGDVTGNHGSQDYWVVKLNSGGIIQWKKSLGGSYQDFPESIRQTSDGGYIIAGYSSSTNGDAIGNHPSGNYWVVKLSESGTVQWQKSYGGSSLDWATDIRQTTDGGYILAGYSQSNNLDVTGNHGGYDAWIVKVNDSGVLQWQRSLGGSKNDLANAIQQTNDGGYIVAGYSQSNDGDVSGNHGGDDYWVVKLDSVGAVQWQKSLGGSSSDQATSVQQTADGGYAVAGYSQSNNGDVTGNHGDYDYWVVKLDNAGTIQWQKSLGGSSGDEANALQQTSDGGYIVAGRSWSKDGDVTGNQGDSDYWVVKLNNTGVLQWQKSLGGTNTDYLHDIQQTTDDGYVMAGQSWSNDGDVSGNHSSYFDYWVVKLNPEKLNVDETALKNLVFVENPVKNQVSINSKEKIISLQLYNMAGRLIKIGNSKNMSVKELPKGIYILKIQLENGKTISEKIIKE